MSTLLSRSVFQRLARPATRLPSPIIPRTGSRTRTTFRAYQQQAHQRGRFIRPAIALLYPTPAGTRAQSTFLATFGPSRQQAHSKQGLDWAWIWGVSWDTLGFATWEAYRTRIVKTKTQEEYKREKEGYKRELERYKKREEEYKRKIEMGI
jgi:hypothetical protein